MKQSNMDMENGNRYNYNKATISQQITKKEDSSSQKKPIMRTVLEARRSSDAIKIDGGNHSYEKKVSFASTVALPAQFPNKVLNSKFIHNDEYFEKMAKADDISSGIVTLKVKENFRNMGKKDLRSQKYKGDIACDRRSSPMSVTNTTADISSFSLSRTGYRNSQSSRFQGSTRLSINGRSNNTNIQASVSNNHGSSADSTEEPHTHVEKDKKLYDVIEAKVVSNMSFVSLKIIYFYLIFMNSNTFCRF